MEVLGWSNLQTFSPREKKGVGMHLERHLIRLDALGTKTKTNHNHGHKGLARSRYQIHICYMVIRINVLFNVCGSELDLDLFQSGEDVSFPSFHLSSSMSRTFCPPMYASH